MGFPLFGLFQNQQQPELQKQRLSSGLGCRAGVCIPVAESTSAGGTLSAQVADGSACFEYVDNISSSRGSDLPFASISSAFSWAHRSGGDANQLPALPFFARIAPPRGGPAASGGGGATSAALKRVEHYSVRRITGDGRCMFRALVLGMAANQGLTLSQREEQEEAAPEQVLSRMCKQPITVYIPESEAKKGAKWGTGYIPIVEYGSEFSKPSKERKGRKPVRLLYNGSNHYDLLV
eukprot:jgi/Mesen1/3758/ME000205S03021